MFTQKGKLIQVRSYRKSIETGNWFLEWVKDTVDSSIKEQTKRLQESLVRAKTESEKKSIIKEISQSGFFLMKEDGNKKQKEILKNRNSFEDVNVIDILSLKHAGTSLENHLLIDKENPSHTVDMNSLRIGWSFEVNFWKNRYMRDGLGIADILPPEIQSIQVISKDGKTREWVLKEIWGKPGYYYKESRVWKYIDVYDGDTVTIKSRVVLSPAQKEFYKKVSKLHYKEEVAEAFMRIREQWGKPEETFSYLDKKDIDEAEKFSKNMEAERDARRKLSPPTKNEQEFLSTYGPYLDSVCKQVNIPQDVMLALFKKESGFNSNAKNPNGSAHGFGQIIDSTWYGGKGNDKPTGESIEKKLLPKYGFHGILDRENPKDQILASVVLLASMRDAKWGNLFKWVMSYFGVNPNDIQKAKHDNPAIEALRIKAGLPDTADGLNQAYVQEFLGLRISDLDKKYDQDWVKNLPHDSSTLQNIGINSVEWLILGQSAKVVNGSTWCGQTARINGSNFWASFPAIYNSSQALSLYDNDEKVVTHDPNLAKNQAMKMWGNVFDIVFQNTHGSKMGHRSCGIVAPNGQIFVYDPYFHSSGLLKRDDPRTPVPYDIYMQEMIHHHGKILVWLGVQNTESRFVKQSA